jgi:IPT/TIG domain
MTGVRMLRKHTFLIALLALIAVFAGCKGESPTAPSSSTTGTVPPTTTGGASGTSIILTATPSTGVIGTLPVIAAAVTINGQPAPNGTAVEFSTTLGLFTESATSSTIRTTTNGVATVTLSLGTAGNPTVTARVADVTKTVTVTITATPTVPVPPSTAPTITSISPLFGKPQGGDTIIITGTNFREPLKVIFEFADRNPLEAFVQSVTATQIVATSPAINLSVAEQQKLATISVIVGAGTATEAKVSSATQFAYQLTVLTPVVHAVSPASGSKTGGTQITIFGSGFQSPLQAFFVGGSVPAELQINRVDFDRIIAVTPPAIASTPGSGLMSLRVVNINSNKEVTLSGAFKYTSPAVITALSPNEGPFTGGTRVTIDGNGFEEPVAVTFAGVGAQIFKVTGSQIIAITNGVQPSGCADVKGPTIEVNVGAQDGATGPDFIYRVPKPVITSIVPTGGGPITPGSTVNVTVFNANGSGRLTLAGVDIPSGNGVLNPDGSRTFTVVVPNVLLQTKACPNVAGALRDITTSFDVSFTNPVTSCKDTLAMGLTVSPQPVGILTVIPGSLTLAAKAGIPATMTTPAVPPQNGSGTYQIVNTGGASLTVTSVNTGPSPPFSSSNPAPATLAPCEARTVAVTYQAESAGTTSVGQSVVNSTVGTQIVTLVGNTQ